MPLRNMPIRKKLRLATLLTSGVVLLVTCTAFFVYEIYTFRQTTIQKLSTLGEVIATNSTAAIAFDSPNEAGEILMALKAEPHIVAACIYDTKGNIFAQYPEKAKAGLFPKKLLQDGYNFTSAYLEGFQPIVQGKRKLGTLYLKSDLGAMYDRFALYGIIVVCVIAVTFLLTYILSRILQKSISKPILALSETAKIISERNDYSVRAIKLSQDELGSLTDAFNNMLDRIDLQNQNLNEFNQNLEQKVAERTKELELANKEMESFSYSISHDLRAPVRAIDSYINIFSEDYSAQLDDEAKRLIGIVSNNSKKMGMLIDDLLAFSKLGRKELLKSKLSMSEVVLDVWDAMLRTKNMPVEFVMEELPEAYAERSTIRQVWVNLLSNAVKYSSKKEKSKIRVACEMREGETIYWVSDNGTGFDMQYYAKLFGVFQRLHAQEEFEGTGVGLAIVQRIIEKHGGKIWADAKLNEGATFYFSLPH